MCGRAIMAVRPVKFAGGRPVPPLSYTIRQKAALDAVHRYLAGYPDPGTFSYRG
jgi:hypothetical protein